MDLQEKLLNAIQTDDSFNKGQENLALRHYKEANNEAKEAIDSIFIALCGYSLETLIKGDVDHDLD